MASFARSTDPSTRVLLVVLARFVAGIWGLAARVAAVFKTDIENPTATRVARLPGISP
jgi:hypothetical protein